MSQRVQNTANRHLSKKTQCENEASVWKRLCKLNNRSEIANSVDETDLKLIPNSKHEITKETLIVILPPTACKTRDLRTPSDSSNNNVSQRLPYSTLSSTARSNQLRYTSVMSTNTLSKPTKMSTYLKTYSLKHKMQKDCNLPDNLPLLVNTFKNSTVQMKKKCTDSVSRKHKLHLVLSLKDDTKKRINLNTVYLKKCIMMHNKIQEIIKNKNHKRLQYFSKSQTTTYRKNRPLKSTPTDSRFWKRADRQWVYSKCAIKINEKLAQLSQISDSEKGARFLTDCMLYELADSIILVEKCQELFSLMCKVYLAKFMKAFTKKENPKRFPFAQTTISVYPVVVNQGTNCKCCCVYDHANVRRISSERESLKSREEFAWEEEPSRSKSSLIKEKFKCVLPPCLLKLLGKDEQISRSSVSVRKRSETSSTRDMSALAILEIIPEEEDEEDRLRKEQISKYLQMRASRIGIISEDDLTRKKKPCVFIMNPILKPLNEEDALSDEDLNLPVIDMIPIPALKNIPNSKSLKEENDSQIQLMFSKKPQASRGYKRDNLYEIEKRSETMYDILAFVFDKLHTKDIVPSLHKASSRRMVPGKDISPLESRNELNAQRTQISRTSSKDSKDSTSQTKSKISDTGRSEQSNNLMKPKAPKSQDSGSETSDRTIKTILDKTKDKPSSESVKLEPQKSQVSGTSSERSTKSGQSKDILKTPKSQGSGSETSDRTIKTIFDKTKDKPSSESVKLEPQKSQVSGTSSERSTKSGQSKDILKASDRQNERSVKTKKKTPVSEKKLEDLGLSTKAVQSEELIRDTQKSQVSKKASNALKDSTELVQSKSIFQPSDKQNEGLVNVKKQKVPVGKKNLEKLGLSTKSVQSEELIKSDTQKSQISKNISDASTDTTKLAQSKSILKRSGEQSDELVKLEDHKSQISKKSSGSSGRSTKSVRSRTVDNLNNEQTEGSVNLERQKSQISKDSSKSSKRGTKSVKRKSIDKPSSKELVETQKVQLSNESSGGLKPDIESAQSQTATSQNEESLKLKPQKSQISKDFGNTTTIENADAMKISTQTTVEKPKTMGKKHGPLKLFGRGKSEKGTQPNIKNEPNINQVLILPQSPFTASYRTKINSESYEKRTYRNNNRVESLLKGALVRTQVLQFNQPKRNHSMLQGFTTTQYICLFNTNCVRKPFSEGCINCSLTDLVPKRQINSINYEKNRFVNIELSPFTLILNIPALPERNSQHLCMCNDSPTSGVDFNDILTKLSNNLAELSSYPDYNSSEKGSNRQFRINHRNKLRSAFSKHQRSNTSVTQEFTNDENMLRSKYQDHIDAVIYTQNRLRVKHIFPKRSLPTVNKPI